MALSILIYYLICLCASMCTCLSLCVKCMKVPMEARRGHQNSQGWSMCSQLWSHFSSPCPLFLFVAFLYGLFPLGSLSHHMGLGDEIQVLGLAASTFMGRAISLAQISSTFIKHLLSSSRWRLGDSVCFCHTVASECFSDGLA